MTRRPPSLVVVLAAWTAAAGVALAKPRIASVDPACATPGTPVVVAGRNLRRALVEMGGVAVPVIARDRKSVTVIVPGTLPSGPTTVSVLVGRSRSQPVAFAVRGPEVCDGIDNDCNGLVDDGIADVAIGRLAGTSQLALMRCRAGRFQRDGGDGPIVPDRCVPDTIEPCYDGAPETRNVGACRDGARICTSDGLFGPCQGQVLPGDEIPGNGIDENCDGRDGPGGGELCVVGTLQTCYTGPPQTRDVGVCRAGARMCDDPGFYGPCEDQVLPSAEIPGNGIDENCDGVDAIVVRQLDLVVNPAASPTFQPDVVLTGSVGSALGPPVETSPFTADVSPRQGHQGESLDVIVSGTNSAFAQATFSVAFGTGVTVNGVTVQDAATAVAHVTVDEGATIGPRVVAVVSGNQQTIAAHSFDVVAGLGEITGRILDADGNPVEGAQVCVSGTTHCATTGADGVFHLPDTDTTGTRILVTKPGFDDFSTPFALSIGGTATLGDVQFAPPEEPPPPPPPNSPPVPPGVAILLGRGATEMRSGSGKPIVLEKLVRDTIVAVGGGELGVQDSQGNQMNPLIQGDGVATLKTHGVEDVAMGLADGEQVSLGEVLANYVTGFTYHDQFQPPRLLPLLAGLQDRVNQAWADPTLPYAPLLFALFNQGRTASVDPPVVTADHPLNRLQEYLLVMSLFTWQQEQVEDGQLGRARRLVPRAAPPDPPMPSGALWGNLFIEAAGQTFGPGVKSGLLKQCDTAVQNALGKPPHCGDGILSISEGETCDPPKAGLCDPNCKSLIFPNPVNCSNTVGILDKLLSNVPAARQAAGQSFTKFFQSEAATKANAARLQQQFQSQAYQDAFKAAQKQATTAAIGNAFLGVARSQVEGVLANLQGKMVDLIFGLEVDLIIQSMRPEPPFITGTEQLVDPNTGDPADLVKITFERSLNDHGTASQGNQTWFYSLWRQKGGDLQRVNLGKVDGANGGPRSNPDDDRELFFYDSPGQGSVLYRVQAKRLIGQPPFERPQTELDTTLAFLAGFIPGASISTKPLTGGGTAIFSFDTLKTLLDPAAKILNGIKFQASELSDPDAIFVNLKPVPPAPPVDIVADPNTSNVYVSIPFLDRIFKTDTGFGALSLFAEAGFKEPGQGGLAIDSSGNLYTDNAASDELYGGRIFKFRGSDGLRTLTGTVNKYSFLLQFARPTGVIGLAVGPSPDGEALYVADSVDNQLKRLRLNVPFNPSLNIAQPVCDFNFGPRAALAVAGNGKVAVSFFNEIWLVDPAKPTPQRLIDPPDNPYLEISGLSWDLAGNLYVSDASRGTVSVIPAVQIIPGLALKGLTDVQRKRFVMARGFTRPSDVSVTADQLGVALFDSQRAQTVTFGLSGQITDNTGQPLPNAQLTVEERSAVAVSDGDGVFTLPNLVSPGVSPVVDLTIRSGGRSQTQRLILEKRGHSIQDLVFDPPPAATDGGGNVAFAAQHATPGPPITIDAAKGLAKVVDITVQVPKALPLPPAPPPADLAIGMMLPVDGTVTPDTTIPVKAVFNKLDVSQAELIVNGVSQGLQPVVNGILDAVAPLSAGGNGIQVQAFDSGPKGGLGMVASQLSSVIDGVFGTLDTPSGAALGGAMTASGGGVGSIIGSIGDVAGRQIPASFQGALTDLQSTAGSMLAQLLDGTPPTAAQMTSFDQAKNAVDQAGRQAGGSGGGFGIGKLVQGIAGSVLGDTINVNSLLGSVATTLGALQSQLPTDAGQIQAALANLLAQPAGSVPQQIVDDATAMNASLQALSQQMQAQTQMFQQVDGIMGQINALQKSIAGMAVALPPAQQAAVQPFADAAAQAVPAAAAKVDDATQAYTQALVAIGQLAGGGGTKTLIGEAGAALGSAPVSAALSQLLDHVDQQLQSAQASVGTGAAVPAAQTADIATTASSVQTAAGGGGFLGGIANIVGGISGNLVPQLDGMRGVLDQANTQIGPLLQQLASGIGNVNALPPEQVPEPFKAATGGLLGGVPSLVQGVLGNLQLPQLGDQLQTTAQSAQLQQIFTTVGDMIRTQQDAIAAATQFTDGGGLASGASSGAGTAAGAAAADHAVVARILDQDTGLPVAGATLGIPGTPFQTTTDKFGIGTVKIAAPVIQSLDDGIKPLLDGLTTDLSGLLGLLGGNDRAQARSAASDIILKVGDAVGKTPESLSLADSINGLLGQIGATAGTIVQEIDQGADPADADVQAANQKVQALLSQTQELFSSLSALMKTTANTQQQITVNLK